LGIASASLSNRKAAASGALALQFFLEYFPRLAGQNHIRRFLGPRHFTSTGGNMNKAILSIACALVAPVAFAQTSTTTTEQTTTTAPATTTTTESTTYSAGTVTTYEPGKTVVVKSDEGPLSFALGTGVRVVNGAGKVVTAPIRAGQKVRVYYSGPTEKRVVERVVVDED
jgi:hypothetical protein